ncbi:hypothetical protein E4U21_003923 [Claviceps maximensis]|nr:hypothetical protein E4U21_003923 [Claviceps maximensis]
MAFPQRISTFLRGEKRSQASQPLQLHSLLSKEHPESLRVLFPKGLIVIEKMDRPPDGYPDPDR